MMDDILTAFRTFDVSDTNRSTGWMMSACTSSLMNETLNSIVDYIGVGKARKAEVTNEFRLNITILFDLLMLSGNSVYRQLWH